MKRAAVTMTATVCLGLLAGAAGAKLPPPSDEAKAKAAEAAAKNAWTDKVGAFQLCEAMDRVAATYAAEAKKAGKEVKPTATPPCADPGPFAYTPPEKPLEAAGAHSPAATATSPPSTKTPAAEQKPAAVKKS